MCRSFAPGSNQNNSASTPTVRFFQAWCLILPTNSVNALKVLGILASDADKRLGDLSRPRCIEEPLLVKDKTGRPHENRLMMHCGSSPWSEQVCGMWGSVCPLLSRGDFFEHVLMYCIWIRDTLVAFVIICFILVFCVLIILVYLSVLAKWLHRKTILVRFLMSREG